MIYHFTRDILRWWTHVRHHQHIIRLIQGLGFRVSWHSCGATSSGETLNQRKFCAGGRLSRRSSCRSTSSDSSPSCQSRALNLGEEPAPEPTLFPPVGFALALHLKLL